MDTLIIRQWLCSQGYFQLDDSIVQSLFDKVVQPLVATLTKLLTEDETSNHIKYDYLVMGGDFSSSGYVQFAIHKAFGESSPFGLSIITPARPSLLVVHGAALIAQKPIFISHRIPVPHIMPDSPLPNPYAVVSQPEKEEEENESSSLTFEAGKFKFGRPPLS